MINALPAIAFLGAVLPDEMCSQSTACSPAANKDMLHLIWALRDVSNAVPSVFSVQPIGAYPKSHRIFMPSKLADLGQGIRCQMIPFINIMFFKQLTIGLANLFYLSGWLWSYRHRSRYILVHNVYSPMSLPVLLATKLFGGTSVTVVMDLPHNMSYDFRGVRGKLQRLNLFVETRALAHFSGIIAYTRYIGEDHASHVPMIVMEGGIDVDEVNLDPTAESADASVNEHVICYSGTLSTINGIELLLDAFRLLQDPQYRLWIFGRGPLESLVRDAMQQDSRIVFWGFAPNQIDVLRSQRRSTVLVNLRLHDHLINRYTFPSKLREYMLSARPVISTAAPGIPDEYLDSVYILREETPLGLSCLLHEVCSKSPVELDEFGQRAREFVLRNKNWTVQGQRVFDFICSL